MKLFSIFAPRQRRVEAAPPEQPRRAERGAPRPAASAPDGAGNDQGLAAARAQALLALGDARGARLALERLSAIPSNAALSQAAAESALTLGEEDQACAIAQALTVDRGGPYWLKLRAYCQAIAGQTDAAALTVSLATAGGKEPVFGRMMNVVIAG